MNYKEDLPESCPPQKVDAPAISKLWRLIPSTQPSEEHFDSTAKKFPRRHYPDLCVAKATSLITSLEACRSISKLPRRNVKNLTHAVEIAYDDNAGVWDHNKASHVSLWLFEGTDPLTLAGEVRRLK